ncbi:MAG: helix-turn-helix domain-containing protein [Spirochaetota bacterium]
MDPRPPSPAGPRRTTRRAGPPPDLRIDAVLKSQPPGYRNAVTAYEQFYLVVVLDGVLHFRDAQSTAAVVPGRMAVLRPGTDFALHTGEDGYSGVAVEVRPAAPESFAGRSAVTEPSSRLRALGEWLRDELALPRPGSAETVSHLAALLVELALRETAALPPGEPHLARAAYWARRAREAIENSVYAAQGVQAVLRPFPVSYRQLTRYLVAEYGATPKELQLAARLDEAKRLLRETGWSVATIALELGFASAQHLTATFAAREGVPPGRWRARAKRGRLSL